MTCELIIFDCDGVLLDNEAIASQVEADMLGELGLEITREEVTKLFSGTAARDMYRTLEEDFGLKVPPSFDDDFITRYRARLERELTADLALVSFLNANTIPICIASNSSVNWVTHGLNCADLLPHFENSIFSAKMVARGKPAPDVYLHAAQTMDTDPAHCLVIEDSTHGVSAGIAANMKTLGYIGGSHCLDDHGERLLSAGAHRTFVSFDDLCALSLTHFQNL